MHRPRRRSFLVTSALVAACALIACRRTKEPPKQAITHDPTPAVAITPTVTKPKVVEKTAERHQAVEVRLAWPLVDLGTGQAGRTMSIALEDELRAEADEIEKEHADAAKEDPHSPWLDGWSVDVACRATLVARGLVSILCAHDDFTGGAHGQHWTTTHVDLVENDALRPLTVRDVFGEKGLEKLAPAVAESLARQEAPDAMSGDRDGKWLLTDDKLAVFCVDRDGMAFVFAPYVVGPYAAGGFVARVDWKTLRAAVDEPATLERLHGSATEADAISVSCGEEREVEDTGP